MAQWFPAIGESVISLAWTTSLGRRFFQRGGNAGLGDDTDDEAA